MADPIVIDVSHYQGNIDFNKVAAAGVVGVIIKATEGETYVDTNFARNRANAIAAGLCVSSYHFLRPGSIEKQMRHYGNTIQPVDGERVCLDYEDDRLTLQNLEAAVDVIREYRPDLQICIYSGHLIKQVLGGKTSKPLQDTALWIAQYTSAPSPDWPKQQWPAWSLWQYTDGESVNGISGPVDGNRWNGSDENLVAWFGPAQPQPEPQPEPQPTAVAIDIMVPEGVPVEVTVNGQVLGTTQEGLEGW